MADRAGPTLMAVAGVLVAGFLVLQLAWLGQDRRLRDGDEEGFVGAAELFADDLSQGAPARFLHRAFVQDMGDYPSLYPATVGAWWWAAGRGDPARPAVRLVGSAWLLLAALATAAVARREVGWPAALAGAACLACMPLAAGLSRHFMPETAVAAAVALAVLAAQRVRERPSATGAAALGLAVALGLLVKQTWVLYALAPLLLTLRWHPSLVAGAAGLLLAVPWYAQAFQEQLTYGAASAEYRGQAGLGAHLAYYPVALAAHALGPVWTGLVLAGAALGWRAGRRRLVTLGLAWLVGGALVLTAVPKKYPRLTVPLMPGAALLLAAGARWRGGLGLAVGGAAGVAWTTWCSFGPRQDFPSLLTQFEPNCMQTWLEPPEPDDAGLAAVAAVVADAPWGPVQVVVPPEVPCAWQTTPDWSTHLGPYLRRVGLDREVVVGQDPGPVPPTVIVDSRPQGQEILLPWGDRLWVHVAP